MSARHLREWRLRLLSKHKQWTGTPLFLLSKSRADGVKQSKQSKKVSFFHTCCTVHTSCIVHTFSIVNTFCTPSVLFTPFALFTHFVHLCIVHTFRTPLHCSHLLLCSHILHTFALFTGEANSMICGVCEASAGVATPVAAAAGAALPSSLFARLLLGAPFPACQHVCM